LPAQGSADLSPGARHGRTPRQWSSLPGPDKMRDLILAIDQGTTSTRALVFDAGLHLVAEAQQEFPQYFPLPGRVEHDPEEIWASTVATCREAAASVGPERIAAIGIANQRET